MKKNERIGDKYPALYTYGGKHAFLTSEEAAAETREARIKSIWPFLVRRVLNFSKTLKPRERVNFDCDDVVNELWAAIAEKDCLWSADRGKYITFAAVIIDRELCAIRDKSRTVQSPRNSSCRMKKYRGMQEDGSISSRCRQTAADIARTGENSADINDKWGIESQAASSPASALETQEAASENLSLIKGAVRQLEPFEAQVLGRFSGLWGQQPESLWMIAFRCGREVNEVRRVKDRAVRKIREHLTAN